MNRNWTSMVIGLFVIFSVSSAYAGLYLRPKAGLLISSGGGTTSTVGAKIGYTFTDYLALSADYTYIDRVADQNQIGASATVFIPLIPVISPYASLGTVFVPSEGNVVAGLGVMIAPPFLDFVSLGVGVDYYYLFDGANSAEVFAMVGIKF